MNRPEIPETFETGDVMCELIPEMNSSLGLGVVNVSVHSDDPRELLKVAYWLKEAAHYLKQKRWENE